MVRDNILSEAKPEEGKGSEDSALLRYAIGKDYIKGRNPVSGDDDKPVLQVVDISHLAAFEEFKAFYISIQNDLVHRASFVSILTFM